MSGGEATLTTLDGATYRVSCGEGETVLDAAAADGVVLPSLCGQGTCGACEATVSSGDVHMGPHDGHLLGQRASRGAVLLCCSMLSGDAHIELPYAQSRVLESHPQPRSGTIQELQVVAHGTFRVVIELSADAAGSTAAEFEPGQFVQLQIPGRDELRAYSMANSGNWDGLLEFFVRFHEGGLFSDYLACRAKVGDALTVHGPQGGFHLVENGIRPRWFVSGGTGVAPLLAMLSRMAEWADPQPARVFHGVNQVDEVFAVDELNAAGGQLVGGFELTMCVREESADYYCGTPVTALKEALETAAELPDIYVCGPPAMVAAIEDVATGSGVPSDQVFVEHFVAT